MSRMLIISGGDAGASAALRIRELDTRADVTLVTADAYPAFSICGLPFWLGGEVTDWHALAHHELEEFEKQGVSLWLDHRAGYDL
jgi:NADPH-dependent 2,4-dienoyl-CoA reductase/sulfur reductase-like enzyme